MNTTNPLKAIIAVLAALCLGSCARLEPGGPDSPAAPQLATVTISARSGDDPAPTGTKSSRDAAGHFYWTPGDAVSLFLSGIEGNWKFTSTNSEPANPAEFSGQLPATATDAGGEFWAIYPYSTDNQFDGSTVTVSVPASQTAGEGTFADGQFISIGHSEGLAMTFYHLCGGIKFTLEQPGVTSVTLSGLDSEPLAGWVKVALDEQEHPVVQEVLEPATSVTLSCPGGFTPGTEYFFVTLPVQFQRGFSIDFGGGLNRTVSAAMRINRAKFQWSPNALDSKFDGFVYETCDIENAGTKSFLARDYSSDPNYTVSYVSQYFTSASDVPLPVNLTWDGGGRATSVLLSGSPLFTDAREVAAGVKSPVKVYNLIPGEKYYYKVLGSGGSVLKQACVTPVGPLRMIRTYESASTAKVYNVRDLGGWSVPGGRHIAYGKIYRGSSIDDLNSDRYAKDVILNQLHATIDFDLRGQKGDAVNPQIAGMTYYQLPVKKNFEGGTGETERLYKKAIRQIIAWLGAGEVIYMHCAAGADRTGTLAFLIEALLGVNESDLSKDFEITSFDAKKDRRYRNLITPTETHTIYHLVVTYLRQTKFGYPETTDIGELVYNWATTETGDDPGTEYVDPLTPAEIALLRQYLLVPD